MLAVVTDSDTEPRPDELPGGISYQLAYKQAETNGGRLWNNASPEERARLVTSAAVSRRRQQAQAERLGYPSMDDYLDDKLDRSGDPTLYRQPKSNGATPAAEPLGIDAADLLALDLPPLRWLVPDVVPEGTTILAAPPKVGKSCFVYQVAVESAVGGELLGRRVMPGSVLYLALEDGKRRGQERLRVALAGRTMPRGRLEVRWSAPRIGDGLEEMIETWLSAHPDASFVALDTLGKVRPRSTGKQGAYEVDVQDLARLQATFRDRDVALIIVHHSRKETSDDFLTSVSGTYGITGSADTIVVLRRKRLEMTGTVLVTGRDVPDIEVSVKFTGLLWEEAAPAVPEISLERSEVYDVIRRRGPIFAKAIADELGKERSNVQHLIDGLLATGAVSRQIGGYAVVDAIEADDERERRARARVIPSLTITHSDSGNGVSDSERGHYARPRATSLWCHDFSAHATRHRDTQSTDPWCELCSPRPA